MPVRMVGSWNGHRCLWLAHSWLSFSLSKNESPETIFKKKAQENITTWKYSVQRHGVNFICGKLWDAMGCSRVPVALLLWLPCLRSFSTLFTEKPFSYPRSSPLSHPQESQVGALPASMFMFEKDTADF